MITNIEPNVFCWKIFLAPLQTSHKHHIWMITWFKYKLWFLDTIIFRPFFHVNFLHVVHVFICLHVVFFIWFICFQMWFHFSRYSHIIHMISPVFLNLLGQCSEHNMLKCIFICLSHVITFYSHSHVKIIWSHVKCIAGFYKKWAIVIYMQW